MALNREVIVVGKNYSTTLGIVKSLGEAGYRCGVVSCVGTIPRYTTPEVLSRYVDKYIYALTRDGNDIIRKLIDAFAVQGEKKILISADDYSASLFDHCYEELSPFFVFPMVKGKPGELTRLMDKGRQKEIAAAVGIKAAKTCPLELSETIVLPEQLPYPCFVKPLESREISASKTFMKKCDSAEELLKHLKKSAEKGLHRVLIEEYIPFSEEYTIPGVAVGSDIIIPAHIKKLKTARGSHKGVTVIGQIQRIEESLTRDLQAFVKATGFEGIFDIEVFRYNGSYYLNEINLRSSAAGYAVTAAGYNLPGIYADFLQGKPLDLSLSCLQSALTFLNEKAELQEYLEGFCSWKQFMSERKSVDVCFLTDKNDPASTRAFLKYMYITKLRKYKLAVKRAHMHRES